MVRSAATVLRLAVMTAVFAGAAVAVHGAREDSAVPGGALMFPDLAFELNDTVEIDAVGEGGAYRIRLQDGRWVIPEKSGYTADQDKVHKLLVGAAALAVVEPKTAKPENYPLLGLEDPAEPGSTSAGYAFLDDDGAPLVRFVVGRRQTGRADPSASEVFLREPARPRVWLVEGHLPGAKGVLDWLDRELIEIDEARIRAVRVHHPDGEVVEVSRDAPWESDFVLHGLPDGARISEQWRVNDIGRGLASLRLDDVARRDERSGTESVRIELTTFDGLRVNVNSFLVDGDDPGTFAHLRASYDPALADAALLEQKSALAARGPGAGEDDARARALVDLLEPEAARVQAETLADRWQAWAYRLPKFKADYFARRVADLVTGPAVGG